MNNFNKNKKGFALLYALLLTGAVLTVGVILMNIITKQLIFSSVNRNSEISYYYAANSGRECLDYYAGSNNAKFYRKTNVGGVKDVEFKTPLAFSCFGSPVPLNTHTLSPDGKKEIYSLDGNNPITIDGNTKVNLTVTFNKNCILYPDDPAFCGGTNLEDRSMVVMKATGYSGSSGGDRSAQRIAIGVVK